MESKQKSSEAILAKVILEHKQSCIDSLLMLTESIASYQDELLIYRQYIRTLVEKFNYKRIHIIYKNNEEWFLLTNKENESKPFYDAQLLNVLSNYIYIVRLPEEEARIGDFDTIIPVISEGYPIAYVMIEGVYITIIDSVEEELRFLQAYTNTTFIAVENQRLIEQEIKLKQEQKELEDAFAVQQALINVNLPNNEFCSFDSVYIPHSKIGGDGYDLIAYPNENSTVLTIADVSGKGMPAALLMSHFQALLRSKIIHYKNPLDFSNDINQDILRVTKGEKFISLFAAHINYDKKEIQYINFGHNPPFLIHNNKLQPLDTGSTIIGVFDKLPFVNVGKINFEAGDILFCYTDGITDAINKKKEAFGENRLKELLTQKIYNSPQELNETVMDALEDFVQGKVFIDDITILTTQLK